MIHIFLFFHLFSGIAGDCLEFVNSDSSNECRLRDGENQRLPFEEYYPKCLLCQIRTLPDLNDIQVDTKNDCSSINLQCIQMEFNSIEMFEHFFRLHYPITASVFTTKATRHQSTLHVIVNENTPKVIDAEYIEKFFPSKGQFYGVLFLELYTFPLTIRIHRNLLNLTRLSIKIILNCKDDGRLMQTIYVFHDRKITLDSREDLCTPIFLPSTSTIAEKVTTTTTTTTTTITIVMMTTEISSSTEIIPLTRSQSKKIILIIAILTSCLLCLALTLLVYCLKCRPTKGLEEEKPIGEKSIHEDIRIPSPEIIVPKPAPGLKIKQPARGMRAVQMLEDEI